MDAQTEINANHKLSLRVAH